uniref:Secreted protein n=1 Tax=Ixodes scapularis TaxID=6945 RepID=A0A4D5S3X9_IXOSC
MQCFFLLFSCFSCSSSCPLGDYGLHYLSVVLYRRSCCKYHCLLQLVRKTVPSLICGGLWCHSYDKLDNQNFCEAYVKNDFQVLNILLSREVAHQW